MIPVMPEITSIIASINVMIQLFMLSFPIHNMINDNIANTPNTNWPMEQIRFHFFIVYLTFMHKKGLPLIV